jgi:hypothetical protein
VVVVPPEDGVNDSASGSSVLHWRRFTTVVVPADIEIFSIRCPERASLDELRVDSEICINLHNDKASEVAGLLDPYVPAVSKRGDGLYFYEHIT